MKTLLSILVCLIPLLYLSQGTISYTSGTSIDYSLPAYGLYDYSVSGFILLRSEIGVGAKEITNISISFGGYSTPYTFNNQDIYLAHVVESQFDSSPNVDLSDLTISNLTKCVDGQSLIINSNGWVTLTFDTNFNYNGVDNLVILWKNYDGAWDVNYGYSDVSNSYTKRSFEKYADGSFPTGTGSRSNSLPNMKLDWITPNPLPVNLVSFTGTALEEQLAVLLKWITATEKDNDYFTIWKSVDGYDWNIINITHGAGNSQQILEYFYLDRDPTQGINYYNLSQTDLNGETEFYGIISVDMKTISEREYIKHRYNMSGQKIPDSYKGQHIVIWNNGDVEVRLH